MDTKPYNSDNFNKSKAKRFKKTLSFIEKHIKKSDSILDLGPVNTFSRIMKDNGYENITNTPLGQDLDLEFDIVKNEFDVITSFEIFEHMVSPFPLLRAIKAKKMLISVPLKLWFASAYWNPNDKFDRHYHEFEVKQFNMLLEKAGWKIIESEKWINTSYSKIGIRPLLRNITPRYYFVYCERIIKS